MDSRTQRTVSGARPANKQVLRAWGRTSGGGAPTLDTPSLGSGSITDAGVGLLDVTWTTSLGNQNYVIFGSVQSSANDMAIVYVSNTTVPSQTAARFTCRGTTAATDPTIGYHWMVFSE